MTITQNSVKKCFLKNIRLFIILLLPIVTSCSGKKSILFKTSNEINVTGTNPNTDDSFSLSEAKIKAGSILSITNVQNESSISGFGVSTPLEIRYLVNSEGDIKLPVIGDLQVSGLTVREAEKIITAKYKESTLLDPLFVVKILNLQVTVLGEFVKQGNYVLDKESTTLTESIANAGGFNTRADKSKVKIIRGNPLDPQVFLVDLTKLQTLTSDKLYLRDGDIIYCQPRKVFLFTDQTAPFFSYVSLGTALVNIIFLLTR